VGDEAEAKAIIRLMQSDVKRFTLSAYKSNFGHTFGAAGAIELIMGLFSMKEELAPKILNLNNPIDGLQFPKHNIQQPIRYMLKNALGFGGINVSMLLKAN
jgi:3-oxoacyl-(acyl-carrier-protein) synthase